MPYYLVLHLILFSYNLIDNSYITALNLDIQQSVLCWCILTFIVLQFQGSWTPNVNVGPIISKLWKHWIEKTTFVQRSEMN